MNTRSAADKTALGRFRLEAEIACGAHKQLSFRRSLRAKALFSVHNKIAPRGLRLVGCKHLYRLTYHTIPQYRCRTHCRRHFRPDGMRPHVLNATDHTTQRDSLQAMPLIHFISHT